MKETLFLKPKFTQEEKYLIEPFFTNLDKSIYAILFLPPEMVGALCSKTSRSKGDLREIFLSEFVKPFLNTSFGKAFKNFVDFLHKNSYETLFANPKAREFYFKWLAQYGDDSIAQISGFHLVFSSLSQIAIKHVENQRIGIAPIEKSTRYVDFSLKVKNHYLYFTPPEIKKMGLEKQYEKVMDNLFETYRFLYQKYFDFLRKKFPKEKEIVLKTKAFDVARLILPLSTLGQVAVFGNAQAFEYLINRSLNHILEEIKWLGKRVFEELNKIAPAFLRRVEKKETKEYQRYLGERTKRVREVIKENKIEENIKKENRYQVKLLEYDPLGEEKIIASLLYPETKLSFEKILEKVKKLSALQKEKILAKILKDRKFRWYKVPRAFESVYLRFEILLNIGAWRDLQRHRMQTQFHQKFNINEGFDVPQDLREIKQEKRFILAINNLEKLYLKIKDKEVAQYAVSFAHFVRFIQFQNLRQFFWESELRTSSQGHPDYRKVEKEKIKILQKIYPLISKYLLADLKDYQFPRRESIKSEKEKIKDLEKILKNKK